ncbi:MAG: hypothetical protein Q609_ECAC02383G0001, partial [Escherichia coli DORA_A_5_14_21]
RDRRLPTEYLTGDIMVVKILSRGELIKKSIGEEEKRGQQQ